MIPLLAFYSIAEGNSEAPTSSENTPIDTSEHYNIATEAIPSVFSNYNLDSKPPYLNDGIIKGQINNYMQWRPQTVQRDPSVEGTDPWIKFKFDEYKEISSVTVLVDHGYTEDDVLIFEALVQGEWVHLGTSKYSESPGYENEPGVRAVGVEIPYGITTKQIRVTFSEYLSWDPPMVCECFIMGKTGIAPEFDVPEGAYLSTNVALSGYAAASSSQVNRYPALGNDDNSLSFWASKSTENNQWFTVNFDKAYSLGEIGLNLSAIKFVNDEDSTPVNEAYNYSVKIELMVNGSWSVAYEGNVATTEGSDGIYTKQLDTPVTATAIKVTYINTSGNAAALTELIAKTSDGQKCMYTGDVISIHQKSSTAGGNLSCYGTPYAESTFTFSGISDVSFINDGLIDDNAFIWVAATPACPVYCGIKLTEVNRVDTVVLYFNDAFGIDSEGDNFVMSFDVYCKDANGNFNKVGSGTSYDNAAKRAVVSVTFKAVMTDDVRIVFTSNGGRMPYLKELEVYGHNDDKSVYVYPHYSSLPTNRGIPYITEDFSEFTVAKRSKFMAKHYKKADMKDIIKNVYKSSNYQWHKTDIPSTKEDEE
jgi:hypothetical protein